jgi:hypothetical protein
MTGRRRRNQTFSKLWTNFSKEEEETDDHGAPGQPIDIVILVEGGILL